MRIFPQTMLTASIILSIGACSHPQEETSHAGAKILSHEIGRLDTIKIDDEYLSGQYNAFLFDSCIAFADNMQQTLSFYSLADGSLSARRLRHGQGPNEVMSMEDALPIQGSDGEIAILDGSQHLYIYTPANDSLKLKGLVDFNWGKGSLNDYDDISNYMLMEMSDFAMPMAKRDSCILVPLSVISRNFEKVDEHRYTDGHIFSNLGLNSMKASEPFGEFPKMYQSRPMPFFEFFDFAIDGSTGNIFYNFAPDSLIYIADATGTPIKTFGFEPQGVNRDYTTGYNGDPESFRNDTQKVGVNTGLYYDPEDGLLFRTSLQNFASGAITLQAYDAEGNLVMETEMPPFFKLLGKHDGYYYGTRFIPQEEADESLVFPIYRFKVIPTQSH